MLDLSAGKCRLWKKATPNCSVGAGTCKLQLICCIFFKFRELTSSVKTLLVEKHFLFLLDFVFVKKPNNFFTKSSNKFPIANFCTTLRTRCSEHGTSQFETKWENRYACVRVLRIQVVTCFSTLTLSL